MYILSNKTFCEFGAAGAALCAVTSTFVGAAKGAVIGAVTGALTGAATGAVQGAVEGYKETGTLEGTLRGMGKGAAKGAVQGAQDGLLSGMVMGGISGAMNPSFCFVAGTSVLTTLGKKAIETVQVGDTIPCVDHITGEATEKKVISTTVNKVNRLIELDIDGEIIQCTETHPFQVKDKGWIDACNLNPSDVVYTKDWGTATVQSVNLLELDEPVEVFNFEVEDAHSYFVGNLHILVHNGSCHDKVWGKKRRQHWKDEAQKIVDNDQFGASMKSYSATDDNIARMVKGKAPIGWDGKSVELHHVDGIATNIDKYVDVTRTTHEAIHTFLHAIMKGII